MPPPSLFPGPYYHTPAYPQPHPYTANPLILHSGPSQQPPQIPRKVPLSSESGDHLSPDYRERQPTGHIRSISQPAGCPAPQEPIPTHRPTPPPAQSTPTRPESPVAPQESPPKHTPWICDGCMDEIAISKPRIHCVQCPDYNLCTACYQKDRVSKTHQSNHQVRRVLRTYVVSTSDMEFASSCSDPNWTIQEDYRFFHLRERNSHARFLATAIEPGHYSISLILCLKISPKLTPALIQQLDGGVLGKLRITVGFPVSRKVFLHGEYPEEGLQERLFAQKTQKEIILAASEEGAVKIEMSAVFHVPANDQSRSQIGFVLQWSEMRSFAQSDEAIMQVALIESR